ncbi:MAG: hypothetical protein GXO22_00715 [Aquificae bacterium]|nr:hypothetical protein [Aquificota bacterium]
MDKKTILLVGIGFYGSRLLEHIKDKWNVIVIEIDKEKIEAIKEEYPQITFIEGDASSILTWKKLNPEHIDYIISTVKDADVSLEVCRIAREVFDLSSQIIVLLYEVEKAESFQKYNVKIIKPVEIVINIILNTLEKNYSKAINIGLGKGEIVEVQILAKSHLVDRLLKYIRPTKWRIAAIYRNGQLIIPSGNERIKVGDTVVLIGEPKVLENLVNILLKGIPQFPLQYGSDAVLPMNRKFYKLIDEAAFFLLKIKVKQTIIVPFAHSLDTNLREEINQKISNAKIINKKIYSIPSIMKIDNNAGIYILPYKELSLYQKFKVKKFFKESKKPYLLLKNSIPYQKIIVSLNTVEPALALEIGIELSRIFNLPFEAIYGTLPKEIRNEEDEQNIQERQNIISDFESIYKKKITFNILEGNPVKESIKYLKKEKNSILIVAHCRKEEISFLSPNVTYLLAKKSPVSTLVVPVEGTYG